MTTSTTTASQTARSTDHVLAALLDDELGYDPIARGDFINHLAMSLVAVRRLGGSDDELQQWYDAQTSGDFLVPRERPAWLVPETDRVWSEGGQAVVAQQLPSLIGSPGSQFFHAIIRLELALDAGHAGQIANALHNWAAHDHPMPSPPSGGGDLSFTEVLSALTEAAPPDGSLPRRQHELAAAPWFSSTLDRLRGDDGLLDDIGAAAADSHQDPRHFGTLHLVTGTRAAQALAPLLEQASRRELALRTAQAVAVVYLSAGSPPLLTEPVAGSAAGGRGTEAAWASVARRAIDSGDPHVAKLVYACRLEEARTGDARYFAVAARQVR